MESAFESKGELTPEQKREAVLAFFKENEIDQLNFDTAEEAQTHVDMVDKKYGDIAFVAEDRGKFSVKFKIHHLGEGFEEYKPSQEKDKDGYADAA